MRSYIITLLLLLTLSTTAYSQVEKLLLTPIGTSERRLVRSAQKIVGVLEETYPWEMGGDHGKTYWLEDQGNLFGQPIKRIAIDIENGKLNALNVLVTFDSLMQAEATYQRLVQYIRAHRGKPEGKGAMVTNIGDVDLITDESWSTRTETMTLELMDTADRKFLIRVAHKSRAH